MPCVDIFSTSPTLGPFASCHSCPYHQRKVLCLEKAYRRRSVFFFCFLFLDRSAHLACLLIWLLIRLTSFAAPHSNSTETLYWQITQMLLRIRGKGDSLPETIKCRVSTLYSLQRLMAVLHDADDVASVMAQWHASVHRHFWSLLCAARSTENQQSSLHSFICSLYFCHLVSSSFLWSYLSVGALLYCCLISVFLVFS